MSLKMLKSILYFEIPFVFFFLTKLKFLFDNDRQKDSILVLIQINDGRSVTKRKVCGFLKLYNSFVLV